MRRILRCAAVLALAGACGPLPAALLGRREVWSKEGEATLVSVAGERCVVGPKQFAETRVGDRVACAWRDPAHSVRQDPLHGRPRQTFPERARGRLP